METLLVTVRENVDLKTIEKALQEIEGVSLVKRIIQTDETSLLSETSLSDEWESEEDQRWDKLI
ncbi:hypothetical protein [Dyadobacter psychrotolerans]|uniref:Uncharacterized protein n=1 Tax=Dyadobacter psychrotolerans TaxID=2541721 RepID=A0A4R5DJ33_9BACT|nr:hypothetical protein [Dyadobacter psychrotolerans]TDE11961.1 hypothetical protein E0F88_23180 [Dyadobacter psychrotolerans]